MRTGKVMRPFRAPRQLQGRPTQKKAVDVESDSEEPTELIMKTWKIKETEDQFIQTAQDKSEIVSSDQNVPDPHGTTAGHASPNLLEFESYLEALDSRGNSIMASSQGNTNSTPFTLPMTKPAHMTTDAWWELVLQTEKERLNLEMERAVPVEEIYPDCASDDDDIPIVNTLLSNMVPKTKKPKKVKSLWTYDTVMEPTGVTSKYWNGGATSERATKQLAKQKLTDLHVADKAIEGEGIM